MMAFARTDQSVIGRWWWTVDRWLLALITVIAAIGVVLIVAASPPVAVRIGLSNYDFVYKHLTMLAPALAIMVGVSLLSPRDVRRLGVVMFVGSMVLLAATLVIGVEIKGARRWIHVPGLSLQPSEFVKPSFAIVAAWLFARAKSVPGFPGSLICIALYLCVAALLLMQPDLGMAFVVSSVWFSQFFLAGLPILLVGVLAILGMGGLVGAYFLLPHVASRINRFLDPASGDTYQVDRSLEAFLNGGLFGTGPGQGTVKFQLPDAHADFIFAVAGEELGLIACIVIVLLFAVVVLRGFQRAFGSGNLFILLAVSGICVQFGLQTLVNMGSSLHLIPTKGMTLPLISYGGSSLLAVGFGLGALLALTRVRHGTEAGA
ncbi:MAG TPA: putative peptidoglycan glycosyltransferase FtsW [Azospirillaceae bacterium]|nr:putative peptidoglycan glycosyltransferase FtsW [Azospirillaceae bacterium]